MQEKIKPDELRVGNAIEIIEGYAKIKAIHADGWCTTNLCPNDHLGFCNGIPATKKNLELLGLHKEEKYRHCIEDFEEHVYTYQVFSICPNPEFKEIYFVVVLKTEKGRKIPFEFPIHIIFGDYYPDKIEDSDFLHLIYEIKYIHEIQNLYFDLTKKQLEFNTENTK